MPSFIHDSFSIGSLSLSNRLIQGPLAGYSCAPCRELTYDFTPPAYCVSEMVSAHDILHKHSPISRYLYRGPKEKILAYQLSGNNPIEMAQAAKLLQDLGANLIDINCGCPKTKMRKKGVGSALLDNQPLLASIISAVKQAIDLPLTVKIRIQDDKTDLELANLIEQAGADAIVVHGRRWQDNYDTVNNLQQIANIKRQVNIPVIANGDIICQDSLIKAIEITGCDAYMISRAGCGQPWIYQDLLSTPPARTWELRINTFIHHLEGLAFLESEHKAVLQSKSLIRYYFRQQFNELQLEEFYALNHLSQIKPFLEGHYR